MGSYLFKKRLKIAIIRDNQKLQMKGQTNLWSKKKDKQLFTKHNPQNSPTATRNLWSLAVFHDPYFAVPLRIWRKKVDASLISSNDLTSFDHRVLDFCDKVWQWLATGRWFSPDTPVSSTNKNCPLRNNWNIVESGVKHHYRYFVVIQIFQMQIIKTTF